MIERIDSIERQPLVAPLRRPFTIASGRLEAVRNVAVRVTLAGGASGWGEIPLLPGVTPETDAVIDAQFPHVRDMLQGFSFEAWREVSRRLALRFAAWPGLRAGVEMAVVDALARRDGEPLYRWFCGETSTLRTDITIPICPPAEAGALAADYAEQGFDTIKTKVGLDAGEDLDRLRAINDAFPGVRLVLDANCGFTAGAAMDFCAALARADIRPVLLEQPVPRDDFDGLGLVSRGCGLDVAADESCRTVADARRIIDEALAPVINIKLAKSGVAEAMDIIALAREAGLRLMIGGMVETRLAMGFSAHLAAGLGGFEFIDLDTPLLLASDPVAGGYAMAGPLIDLAGAGPGLGAAPHNTGQAATF